MSLVQYIILRKDLQTVLSWPLGAIIAQSCHASASVLHIYREDENTKKYLADLENMRKVVLQAPDELSLKDLATKLTNSNIHHKLWIEQPENTPTCIATMPYTKDVIKPFVSHFKLYS